MQKNGQKRAILIAQTQSGEAKYEAIYLICQLIGSSSPNFVN